MKRLVKISKEHYVVIEGFETEKVGVFVYDNDYEPPVIYKTCEGFFEVGKSAYRITYSFGKELEGTENRPLSEAQEIEYGHSVDEMAEKEAEKLHSWEEHSDTDIYKQVVYEDAKLIKIGINTHKELTKDKVFTLQDLKEAFYQGHAVGVYLMDHKTEEEFERFVESKKTPNEWEVDIIDGKIVKK